MRLRNVKNAENILEQSSYVVKEIKQPLFSNSNPIYLEIGMGKGDFIIENAMRYPNINFIGIEKYASVMVRAVQKLEEINLPNLKFICTDAKNVNTLFQKNITLTLKYKNKERVITGLKRISKPGLRVYANAEELPTVLNGLGIAIISTSKGIMTDKEARKLALGGEVIAYVW